MLMRLFLLVLSIASPLCGQQSSVVDRLPGDCNTMSCPMGMHCVSLSPTNCPSCATLAICVANQRHQISSTSMCYPRPPCNPTSKYRSHTGWCNNLANPGITNSKGPFIRELPAVYTDGVGSFRRSVTGGELPNPRAISNVVHSENNATNAFHSHMVMQLGQFVDHDMTITAAAEGIITTLRLLRQFADLSGKELNCTACNSANTLSSDCMPIPLPRNERHFEVNLLSPWLDGSQIYGSDECLANTLRLNVSGMMNYTANISRTNHMASPQGNQFKGICNSLSAFRCFVAGDIRNYEQPGLVVPHTIFLREHNRLAVALQQLMPTWNDERLYQEARRINIAQLQHIIYNEMLPRMLGVDVWRAYELNPSPYGQYFTGYQQCDGSIGIAFATAAYRFGHSMIRDFHPRLNLQLRRVTNDLPIGDNFFNTDAIYNDTSGGVNTLAQGLMGVPIMSVDRAISNSVRNSLYSYRGIAFTAQDLPSLNIMRGRDHGLAPYNQYREFCGISKASDFTDLYANMPADAVTALQSVYASVDDIDLWTAVVSETPVPGGLIGPTGACLLGKQFSRLKRCDRFFYESNNNPYSMFTIAQLDNIRAMTFSSIICQNVPAAIIQPQALDLPGEKNDPNTPCGALPRLDLNLFIN